MANEFKVKNGLIVDQDGAIITGSVVATGGFTGSFSGSFTGLINSASYAATASNVIGGSTDYIPLWNSNTTLGSSSLYQAAPNQIILGDTASIHGPGEEEALAVYQGTTTSYNLISGHSDVDNYSQLNIKNFNSGSNASSDIVVTADTGTELVDYIDMGINSSGYTNTGLVGSARDAYVYSTGNNLLIGNASPGQQVIIFNGGTDTVANAKMYIHDTNVGVIGINTDTIGDINNPAALRVLPPNNNTYNMIETEADLNGFVQSTFTNLNSGSDASSDVVAYNDVDPINKTDGFIDMGITSTGYNDPINFPGWNSNTSYVYTTAKMLVGTVNTTGSVDFFAGGINPQTNRKLRLNYANQHELSGSLDISGSGRITNGLTVTGSLISPSITGSLLGTASYATQALSASFATTASYVLNAVSSSFATTASYALNTPPTFIDNLITVGLSGSNTNYNSIKLAVDSITDATSTNTYTVKVGPGLYNEDPIQLKSFVAVIGESSESTIVQATNPSSSLFLGADQSFISDMKIQGVTAPSASAILYSTSQSIASQAILYIENIRFGSNYTHVKNFPVSGANSAIQCTNVKYGAQPFTLGFHMTSDGISTGRLLLRNVTTTAGGIQSTTDLVFAKADQPNCTIIANLVGLTKVGSGPAQGIGFWVENGGLLRINTANLQRFDTGIYAPQVGSAPTIDAVGLNFENCTTDVNIIHTGSLGKVAGTDTFLKTLIPYEAPLYEVGTDQRKILVNKKGGDFNSISASVAYITDSSETNRYVIEVGPGEFFEKTIDLRGKPYVSIVGSNIQATHIMPSGSGNFDQFIVGPTNEISFMSIMGYNNPGYAAIVAEDLGENFAQAHKISIYDFDYGVKVISNASHSTFYGEYIDINGSFSYGVYVSSSAGSSSLVNLDSFYLFPSGGISTVGTYAVGPGSELGLYSSNFVGDFVSASNAIKLEDGAICEVAGIDIQNWGCGLVVPNSGSAPTFRIVGGMIHNSLVSDFDIAKVGTQGRFQGISDHTKINNVSEDFYWNFLDDSDGENDVTRKLSVTFADGTHTDATTLIFKGSPMGVMQGGEITISGSLTINTAAGFGYLENSINPDVYQRIDWVNSTLALSPNTENYIYLDENESLLASSTSPNSTQNIILGRVVTNATGIEFIDQSPYDAAHTSNKLSKFNRDALGPVFAQGSTVTENVTPFKLDVTAGSYFFSENNFQPSGTSSINLNRYYSSGSGWNVSTSSIVPNNVYASGSQLTPMSASYFTKHTVYLVGQGVDEKYFLLINNNQYSSLVDTEAASLPAAPTYFNDGVVPIAAVYVQSGSANITQIQDVRPIIGFRTAGVNASSVHGNLSGLAADDHTQYLLVSGTRQMAGNLGLGGNVLYNFSNVSGSKVQTTQLTASVASITSITGSLLGTASSAVSSSYALSASFAPSTPAFPYIGAAKITGSLVVSGSGGGNASLDTITSELKDYTGTVSIGWSNRFLYDSTGTATTVDYGQGILYDLSVIDSIHWINRTALDSGGNNSIDWGNRIIYTPNASVALNYSTTTDDTTTSDLYSSNIIASVIQRNLARNALYAGQIIEGTIDVGATLYDIMYLDTDAIWYPLKNLPTVSTKMLGIWVGGSEVLIEGDMAVSDDGSVGNYTANADHGLPVYLSGTTGRLTTVVPTNDVVRIVGHIYYQDPSFTNVWLMKFRPSNEWYEI